MARPWGRRAGHSLPELVVAMAFLGATTGATAAAALHAYRVTAAAVGAQEAFSAAALVLDSLLLSGDPRPGAAVVEGFGVRWEVEPDGGGRMLSVRVEPGRPEGSRTDLHLGAFWIPAPPELLAPELLAPERSAHPPEEGSS